jgi:hypothetical protein
MRRSLVLFLVFAMLGASQICLAQWTNARGEQGFLDRPPVYINNEPDFPLTGLGGAMPAAGQIIPDVDVSGVSADHWNENGHNVQPGLDVETQWIRVGAMRGFNGGWAAGISVPFYRNLVKGSIGGRPATSIAEGLGGITLGGKKILWEDKCHYSRVSFAGGIELPTGKDDAVFNQSNPVTNGYFPGLQRAPLGWQPGTGASNGLLALSYTHSRGRFSYEGLLAGKIFGTGTQDVKVGNILIAAAQSTYGVSRDLAASLGLTLRTQVDDSYPNAPLVATPALAGTTTHSALLYLDAQVRYVIMRKVTVGVGIRTPINTPTSGMDPTTQFSVIFYPSM